MRIVQGVPVSWSPVISTKNLSDHTTQVAWSPCNSLIAISSYSSDGVQILDALTLKQLKLLIYPQLSLGEKAISLVSSFSPGGCTLTSFTYDPNKLNSLKRFISWDLQTGIPVSNIIIEENLTGISSITYSVCGVMFGALFMVCGNGGQAATISIYNSFSGKAIYHHMIRGNPARIIWTHGECVQFAILGTWSITIWEVEYTSQHPPTVVKILPTPDKLDPWSDYLFHPTSRLAFRSGESLFVWNASHSKLLLDSTNTERGGMLAFSPDGDFFACVSNIATFLWKESSTGYILYQKTIFYIHNPTGLLVYPNGQLVTVSNNFTLELRHTMDTTTSSSSIITQDVNNTGEYVLEFSCDGLLVATARLKDTKVIVLDLETNAPQLIINTDMHIYGLKLTKSSVIVVGNGQIITWNLPLGNSILGVKADIDNSVQTTFFHLPDHAKLEFASISPNLSYIAIVARSLRIYDMPTGKLLACATTQVHRPWFTQAEHEIWGSDPGDRGWAIVRDSKSNNTRLKYLGSFRVPSQRFPCQSSYGHQVTDNGWILNSSGKQLLWLPQHWRSDDGDRIWGGPFLGLIHSGLPEAVILELPKE